MRRCCIFSRMAAGRTTSVRRTLTSAPLTPADNAQNLPPLNPAQQAKLKQLSLVTAAGASRRLRYDVLRAQLDIRSDRELCADMPPVRTDRSART